LPLLMPPRRHSQLPLNDAFDILKQEAFVRQQTDAVVKERAFQELLVLHAQIQSNEGKAARQIRELQTRIEFCSQDTVRTDLTKQLNILQARLDRKRELERARVARFRASQQPSENLPPQARSERAMRRRSRNNEAKRQQRQANAERVADLENRNDLSQDERAELAHLVGARMREAIKRRQRHVKLAQKRLSLVPTDEPSMTAP
jgi:hypothetical protein